MLFFKVLVDSFDWRPILSSIINAYFSLLEVTITSMLDQGSGAGQSMTIAADIEPNFLALGPYHLALGMNNRAW